MGLHAPFPFVRHLRLGDGLDALAHRGLLQLESAGPSWIISATNVANLMNPALKRADAAGDERQQEVIRRQLGLHLVEMPVNQIQLGVGVFGVEIPIELLGGRADVEPWKIEEVLVTRALHIEECPLPLPAGLETLNLWEDGIVPR